MNEDGATQLGSEPQTTEAPGDAVLDTAATETPDSSQGREDSGAAETSASAPTFSADGDEETQDENASGEENPGEGANAPVPDPEFSDDALANFQAELDSATLEAQAALNPASDANGAADATIPSEAAPVSTSESTPPVTGDLAERWASMRSEIEDNWVDEDGNEREGMEGEKRLVAFMDGLTPTLAKMEAVLAQVEAARQQAVDAAIQSEAESVLKSAQEAAEELQRTHGILVHPLLLMGTVENGGLRAIAALEGKDVSDYRGKLDKDIFMRAFRLKNEGKLQKIATLPKKPGRKPASTGISSGSNAPAGETGPQSDVEAFRAARMEVAGRKGVTVFN